MTTHKTLFVILDEIENKAADAAFSYRSSGSGLKLNGVARTDVPALVNALRRAMQEIERRVGFVTYEAEKEITAILEEKE